MTAELEARAVAFQRCIEQRDAVAAASVLHDDYALVLVHPTPVTIPRDRWLEILPDYVVHEYTSRNVSSTSAVTRRPCSNACGCGRLCSARTAAGYS